MATQDIRLTFDPIPLNEKHIQEERDPEDELKWQDIKNGNGEDRREPRNPRQVVTIKKEKKDESTSYLSSITGALTGCCGGGEENAGEEMLESDDESILESHNESFLETFPDTFCSIISYPFSFIHGSVEIEKERHRDDQDKIISTTANVVIKTPVPYLPMLWISFAFSGFIFSVALYKFYTWMMADKNENSDFSPLPTSASLSSSSTLPSSSSTGLIDTPSTENDDTATSSRMQQLSSDSPSSDAVPTRSSKTVASLLSKPVLTNAADSHTASLLTLSLVSSAATALALCF